MTILTFTNGAIIQEIIFSTEMQQSMSHFHIAGGVGKVPVIIMKRGCEGEMGCAEFRIKGPLQSFCRNQKSLPTMFQSEGLIIGK